MGLSRESSPSRRAHASKPVLMLKCRFSFVFLLISAFFFVASAQVKPELKSVKVLSYNLYNYNSAKSSYQLKSNVSRQATASVIADIDADIILLSELGHGTALDELLKDLADRGVHYSFQSVVNGPDKLRRLCVLAKFAPVKVDHLVDLKYKIKGQMEPVARGFAYCVFEWDNKYRLHFIGAHLKSKIPHPLGQTDMRRYEARQLHYLVDSVLKTEPDANILVTGDMNDSYSSSAIKEIQYRRYKDKKRLYDLRPFDRNHGSWTHYYDKTDNYSRIDYFFASYGMLGEIDYENTKIPFFPHWFIASDHRAIVTSFTPENKNPQVEMKRFENATLKSDRPLYQSAEHFQGPRKASKENK